MHNNVHMLSLADAIAASVGERGERRDSSTASHPGFRGLNFGHPVFTAHLA